MPSSSAGETAGNAARFAAIVTPGTSWKWNSSSGVTPSCAASVVPAASATGAGRNRSRCASGVAIATIPAVAVTDSWKPIAHTSHGSSTIRNSTAPARIEPVDRGRPISTPVRVSEAITPARMTEGSAPVSTTKNATVPRPSANRGHRVSFSTIASPSTGPSTIATFSPDTTSRWPRPVAWKSRSSPGSSCESSPSARPSSSPASFGGNSRAIERPTNERKTWVARRNGLVAPPVRRNVSSVSSATTPRCRSDSANPGSSGTRSVPSRSTPSPRTARGTSPSPLTQTDSRSVHAPPALCTRVTSTVADHP